MLVFLSLDLLDPFQCWGVCINQWLKLEGFSWVFDRDGGLVLGDNINVKVGVVVVRSDTGLVNVLELHVFVNLLDTEQSVHFLLTKCQISAKAIDVSHR